MCETTNESIEESQVLTAKLTFLVNRVLGHRLFFTLGGRRLFFTLGGITRRRGNWIHYETTDVHTNMRKGITL
jgi:hypothetical protein